MKSDSLKQNLSSRIDSMIDQDSKIESIDLKGRGIKFKVYYIESIVDKKMFSSNVLLPIQKFCLEEASQDIQNVLEVLKNNIVCLPTLEEISEPYEVMQKILQGNAVIVVDDKALSCPLFNPEKRGIEEPPTSKTIKGPREGFVEDLRVNTGLVRKRIKSDRLRIVDVFVGKKTNTQISIVYVEKIAKPELVKEIKKRIESIDIDAINDSYAIESFLEGSKLKFVRRVGNTEKPDVFCAKILEGRVGVIVDGSPIALTAPFVLFEDLQTVGDYNTIPAMVTFERIMRICGLVFAILLPGIYVALQSYNYRILPINFLISLLSSIEGLSIPPLIEILVVLLLFEVITEASLQMPNSLAMSLSIIGALALGNTAVDAGIISPPSIVVVAVSSVSLYIIPDQISTTRLLRLLFTIIGGIIGLYGIIMSFIILTTYLTSIKSFGVPFFMPYAPSIAGDKKDGFIKEPIQKMDTRPELIADEDKVRQKLNVKELDLGLKKAKQMKKGTKNKEKL